MPWNGARTSNRTEQVYLTQDELSKRVSQIAKKSGEPPFAELGVGTGQLFRRLPSPKEGVELRSVPPSERLPQVSYGTDALLWNPSRKVRTVVMNPPFAKQVEFFNHAASFASAETIVWIAGLNIRWWSTEDKLDHFWHLEKEWVVPEKMSQFTRPNGAHVTVRTVVQVWRRKESKRQLWSLTSSVERISNQLHPPADAILVRKTGTPSRVGESCRASACLREDGTTSLGTLKSAGGTAMLIRLSSRDHNRLKKLFENGTIRDLVRFRSHSSSLVSLTMTFVAALLKNPTRLRRPFDFLDGVRRDAHQW